jgi:hypothetical protein
LQTTPTPTAALSSNADGMDSDLELQEASSTKKPSGPIGELLQKE